MSKKHLRMIADDGNGNPTDVDFVLYCDHCGGEEYGIISEPNSFKDVFEELMCWNQEHAGCTKAERPAKKKKKKTEPDPMATAQASVLRERMGKLA